MGSALDAIRPMIVKRGFKILPSQIQQIVVNGKRKIYANKTRVQAAPMIMTAFTIQTILIACLERARIAMMMLSALKTLTINHIVCLALAAHALPPRIVLENTVIEDLQHMATFNNTLILAKNVK